MPSGAAYLGAGFTIKPLYDDYIGSLKAIDPATGDIKFWAPHADMFDSPKAYAIVIHAMLDQGDFVGSMALLVHWLGQAERIGLEKGTSSFNRLAENWMSQMIAPIEYLESDEGGQGQSTRIDFPSVLLCQ